MRLDPAEVGGHHSRAGRLPARDAEPLLTDGVQALPLKYQEIPIAGYPAWGAPVQVLASTKKRQLWMFPPLSLQLPPAFHVTYPGGLRASGSGDASIYFEPVRLAAMWGRKEDCAPSN